MQITWFDLGDTTAAPLCNRPLLGQQRRACSSMAMQLNPAQTLISVLSQGAVNLGALRANVAARRRSVVRKMGTADRKTGY